MEPCDLTATAARTLIGRRALSPVELTASCIARTEALDQAVNAIPARCFDRARAEAKAAEARVMSGANLPPLHGLPVGIKDTQAAEGLPFTMGSLLFRDHRPAADSHLVAALRAAGTIVLGKTNTPEFAAGANTRNAVYGATGNPFDNTRSAAGSSGGSAVALACGMVPLATGSDTGGSLRNPAAFCGVVGFRPSPGLVPAEAHIHGWSPLPVDGPMARTVPDLCLLLSAMVGDDARDPLATRVLARHFATPAAVDLQRLRVAITPDLGFAPTERAVAAAFADKTNAFRHVFARAEDAAPDCTGVDRSFAVLRAVGFLASHGARVRDHAAQIGPNVHANVAEALTYTAADIADALSVQTKLYRAWLAFYADYDIILTPSVTISPRPWSELAPTEIDGRVMASYYQWLGLAYAPTLVGHPAVSIPVGVDGAGMPFGLQIIGRRGGDLAVLAAAAALENLLGQDARTARPLPDLARLGRSPPIAAMDGFMGFS